ncbi:MAG: hypothetical protein JRG91_20125, partial [Deltaproteobacteria bacterium]|nr:hypothetical protein [Deltaproteobacteria bacterium]
MPTPAQLFLGIDAGSISLDAVLLDGDGETLDSVVLPTHGRTLDALVRALRQLDASHPGCTIMASCATGSGRGMLASLAGGSSVNEITAHALGTGPLMPDATPCSLLEIGGQDSKFIQLERRGSRVEVDDYAMNTLCAAGTGTFFDGQAERLELSIEEFSSLAANAPRAAQVAGRCVVFAKTDIIHHQQRGTPLDELALGLCHTAARNIIGTLIRGRPVHRPLYFTGGVAANAGMVRALREVFDLPADLPIVPVTHRVLGAVGAALRARESIGGEPQSLSDMADRVSREASSGASMPQPGSLSRVPEPVEVPRPAIDAGSLSTSLGESRGLAAGFDLGSVSVKWALVEDGRIVDSYYAFTQGRPVQSLAESFEKLRTSKALAGRRIDAIGVTGSGRKMASRLLSADAAINEITAHATAMRVLDPDVDTLFEIGGQDAKFVRLEGDAIVDFALNTACSAGTGSLLLEESVRLGLSVSELDDAAERSGNPEELHDRCTVFIDSDLVSRMQSGTAVEDLAAGLLRAVARNYVERVLAGRTTGEHIVFAGGVSRSRVVTRELSRLLGRKVVASPWGALSGAIGAALIASVRKVGDECHDPASMTIPLTPHAARSIRCRGCGAACAVTRLEFEKPDADRRTVRLFAGDACGRWSERTDGGPDPDEAREVDADDVFERRMKLYGLDRDVPPLSEGQVGVLRAQQMWDHYPLLRSLMKNLGFETGLSAPTRSSTIQKGIALSRSEQCMPIKVALAHAQDLLERGASALLVPSLGEYQFDRTLETSEMDRLLNCVYTIQLGAVVR